MMNIFDTTKKFEKLMALADHIDFDAETKTLIIDDDINIKVKGNYTMEVDKHICINSGQDEDPILKIPYSIFINSEDPKARQVLEQLKKLL
jgi:hypothetical protein